MSQALAVLAVTAALAACQAGLYAPVDYSVVHKANLLPGMASRYAIRDVPWSWNIVYNTKVFGAHPPQNWAAVWAYAQAHPRRVALYGARPDATIEVALMAAGVPMDKVYPLTPGKLDLAYRSLDKI